MAVERIDLVGLVDRAVADGRTAFERAGVAIEIGGVAGPQWVEVDPARMLHTVSEVLGHAREATPRGGQVAVAVTRDGESLVLQVRAGAAQRVDLASVVELQRASLAVRGAEVTMSLPLAPPRGARPARLPPLGIRRVLVIEDQRDSSQALASALSWLGLEVRTAASGQAGIEAAREFAPQVVLCDIGLPGMDGYEVARAFGEDPELRGAYLVALSGHTRPEDVERARAAGFMRHVAKPASLDALATAIAAAST